MKRLLASLIVITILLTLIPAVYADTKWNNSHLDNVDSVVYDQKISVSLKQGDTLTYLFTVHTSGIYSAFTDTNRIHVDLLPIELDSSTLGFSPESIGLFDTENEHGQCWYLKAGYNYELMVTATDNAPSSGEFADGFIITSGFPACGQYGAWDISQPLTVTVDNSKFEYVTYVIIPESTGKYMIKSQEGIRYYLTDNRHNVIHEKQYSAPINEHGYVYSLTAGERYFMTFLCQDTNAATATFSMVKYDKLKDLELKYTQFTGNFMTVALFSTPNCAGAEDIQWSISDPSIFHMQVFGSHVELDALKEGSAVLTATIGNQSAKLTVSTNPETQVIAEGKEAYLYLRYPNPAATFTAPESGKYDLTLSPQLLYATDRMRVIVQKPDGGFLYDNYQLGKETTVTLELIGGTKYEILLDNGIVEATFTMLSSTESQTQPTESTHATTATHATQPSTGSNASHPTQESTAPTPPSNDPTDPVAGTEPDDTDATKPTSPADVDENTTEHVVVSKPITKEEMTEAIQNATDGVLSFTAEDINTRTFQVSADALQAAIENDCTLSLQFPSEMKVQLPPDILESISKTGEDISVSIKPLSFGALNEKQQKAMEDRGFAWLKDISLTVGGQNIHQLGGKAQITFPNDDTGTEWAVWYLAEDGSVEVMDITCGEDISFTTEHFSYFALVQKENPKPVSGDADSNSWIAIPIVLVILAGGGTAAYFLLKKKGFLPLKKTNQ